VGSSGCSIVETACITIVSSSGSSRKVSSCFTSVIQQASRFLTQAFVSGSKCGFGGNGRSGVKPIDPVAFDSHAGKSSG